MKRHPIHLGFGLSLVLMLAACSDQPASPTAPSAVDNRVALSSPGANAEADRITIASSPADDRSTANFEVRFLTGMIDHHQMAVEMARICVQNAVHQELRAMCEDIIAAQLSEIEQMQTWLQQWYGISHEPVMNPGDQRMMERLASLNGAEFEIAFMEMMVKHHEKAIKEARHCLDKAGHAELRTLCQNIIATQSAEISQMQTWLCEWYGQCR